MNLQERKDEAYALLPYATGIVKCVERIFESDPFFQRLYERMINVVNNTEPGESTDPEMYRLLNEYNIRQERLSWMKRHGWILNHPQKWYNKIGVFFKRRK